MARPRALEGEVMFPTHLKVPSAPYLTTKACEICVGLEMIPPPKSTAVLAKYPTTTISPLRGSIARPRALSKYVPPMRFCQDATPALLYFAIKISCQPKLVTLPLPKSAEPINQPANTEEESRGSTAIPVAVALSLAVVPPKR